MKKIISAKLYLIGVSVLPLLMLSNMAVADAHNKQGESEAEKAHGYNVNDRGSISRNSTGLCWRSGFWTEEMAIPECDPDGKPPVEKHAATPAPAPLTSPEKITLSAALRELNRLQLSTGSTPIIVRSHLKKLIPHRGGNK